MNKEKKHVPVLLKESIELLSIKKDGVYVDLTTGLGGHSIEISKRLGDSGLLICIDMDKNNLEYSKNRILQHEVKNKLLFVEDNFKNIKHIFNMLDIEKIDGFIADLGVASVHLDDHSYGLSYRFNSIIDMRLSKKITKTAQDFFLLEREEIETILKDYGEIKGAKKLADMFIVKLRHKYPNITTFDVVNVVKETFKNVNNRVLSMVFQAIRIWVNEELENLRMMLYDILPFMKVNSRGVILSYHSLEDRIVKEFIKEHEIKIINGYKDYNFQPILQRINKKPIIASREEVQN